MTYDIKNCMQSKTTVIYEDRNSTYNKTSLVGTHYFKCLENSKTYCESELAVKCVLQMKRPHHMHRKRTQYLLHAQGKETCSLEKKLQ